jgi:hypothetical protein
MNVTQEAIFAEINYRHERALAAALGEQVRKARRESRVRRWRTRFSRHPGRVGGRPNETHLGQRHRVAIAIDEGHM